MWLLVSVRWSMSNRKKSVNLLVATPPTLHTRSPKVHNFNSSRGSDSDKIPIDWKFYRPWFINSISPMCVLLLLEVTWVQHWAPLIRTCCVLWKTFWKSTEICIGNGEMLCTRLLVSHAINYGLWLKGNGNEIIVELRNAVGYVCDLKSGIRSVRPSESGPLTC